jgi:hypothetical protein
MIYILGLAALGATAVAIAVDRDDARASRAQRYVPPAGPTTPAPFDARAAAAAVHADMEQVRAQVDTIRSAERAAREDRRIREAMARIAGQPSIRLADAVTARRALEAQWAAQPRWAQATGRYRTVERELVAA